MSKHGKRHFIQLNEARIDPRHIVAYQRKYDQAANKSQVFVVLQGGALLTIEPIDEQHTPDMIALIEKSVRK